MPAKAEDEGGLTPVEDDNVGRREIYRKYATISRTSDYTIQSNAIHAQSLRGDALEHALANSST